MLKATAVHYLKLFYKNTPGDWVSVQEIYAAANRTNEPEDKNKTWLGNKALYMRNEHGLIETTYDTKKGSTPATISGYRLTDEGLRILGRVKSHHYSNPGTPPPSLFDKKEETNGESSQNAKAISLQDVMREISRLRKENPEFEITFNVTLKNG